MTWRPWLLWGGLAVAVTAPIVAAGMSPLLAWRQPVYIVAGFAGILALSLLALQPLLAGRPLPGLGPRRARVLHRVVGPAVLICVLVHVGGLWVTSPPDVIDALLLRSPTLFSVWGVLAMVALGLAALLAALRAWLSPTAWRLGHSALVAVAVLGTVVHALLIEGTMEPVTKTLLCVLTVLSLAKTIYDRRAWRLLRIG
ncbi:MAG: ferric reductase-like transmembrane domain-containing protein [Pseudomonadota bacterium]